MYGNCSLVNYTPRTRFYIGHLKFSQCNSVMGGGSGVPKVLLNFKWFQFLINLKLSNSSNYLPHLSNLFDASAERNKSASCSLLLSPSTQLTTEVKLLFKYQMYELRKYVPKAPQNHFSEDQLIYGHLKNTEGSFCGVNRTRIEKTYRTRTEKKLFLSPDSSTVVCK